MNGFEELKSAYSPYPDACFYVSYMVGIGDCLLKSIQSNFERPNDTNSDSKPTIKSRLLMTSIALYSILNQTKNKLNNQELENLIENLIESSFNIISNQW